MENKNRLTESDDLGNWGIKGLLWKNLYEGEVITREVHEKLYECLEKLKDYEETELTPKEVDDVASYIKLARENNCAESILKDLMKYKEIGTVEEFRILKEKDKEKSIDEFIKKFIYKAVCEGCSGCTNCYEEEAQNICDDWNYYMAIAEQLKIGASNENKEIK